RRTERPLLTLDRRARHTTTPNGSHSASLSIPRHPAYAWTRRAGYRGALQDEPHLRALLHLGARLGNHRLHLLAGRVVLDVGDQAEAWSSWLAASTDLPMRSFGIATSSGPLLTFTVIVPNFCASWPAAGSVPTTLPTSVLSSNTSARVTLKPCAVSAAAASS